MIRSAGARAGLALNPATPVEPYADLLPEIDMLLLMTVEPGFGGQPFLDLVLPKLRRARALVAGRGGSVWLQVDGGVSDETIERCAEAGADVFVAGSAVYDADDPRRGGQALRAQAERATAPRGLGPPTHSHKSDGGCRSRAAPIVGVVTAPIETPEGHPSWPNT